MSWKRLFLFIALLAVRLQGTAPVAPTSLSLTGAIEDKVTFYWNAVPGAGYYNVYLNGVVYAQPNNNLVKITELNQGMQYTFGVSTVDVNNAESPVSVYLTFTPTVDLASGGAPAFSAPNGLNVTCTSGCAGSASTAYSGVSIMAQASPLSVSCVSGCTGDTTTQSTTTFTSTGISPYLTATVGTLGTFSMTVKGTGASPTSWSVNLEGSLDGVNFTSALTHTNTNNANGAILYSGFFRAPSKYIRAHVTALVLGSATNITVTMLGVP